MIEIQPEELSTAERVRSPLSMGYFPVLTSTAGAMLLATALKWIFQRKRPVEEDRRIRLPKSHSFPSAHSLMAAATFPVVVHHLVDSHSPFVQVAAQLAAGTIVVSIGLSRVYFAVHFPSDVFGGFAAGFGWLGLTSLSHTIHDRDLAREERLFESR